MDGEEKVTVTRLEAQGIAKDAAQEALDRHMKLLPDALKPMIYEVAEKVAAKGEAAMRELFSSIFGVDVENKDHVRELQKDLYWARDRRIEHEQDRRMVRSAVRIGALRVAGYILLTAMLTLLGVKAVGL